MFSTLEKRVSLLLASLMTIIDFLIIDNQIIEYPIIRLISTLIVLFLYFFLLALLMFTIFFHLPFALFILFTVLADVTYEKIEKKFLRQKTKAVKKERKVKITSKTDLEAKYKYLVPVGVFDEKTISRQTKEEN